jgi:Ca2+-binding RTX toxin-like protein
VPAEVYGGGGNDRIKAGRGPSILLGETGNDDIEGGDDRDILIGGIGADKLRAKQADDILIGGTTSLDANPTALRALQTQWRRTDLLYGPRVSSLSGVLNSSSVFNDNASDQLDGDNGLDWFFGSSDDVLKGFKSGEVNTVI